jgi:hypothetical protein
VSVEGNLVPAHTMWHAEPVLIDAPEANLQLQRAACMSRHETRQYYFRTICIFGNNL